jgi:hypothetical protein
MSHTSQRGLGAHAYARAAVEPEFLRSVSTDWSGVLAAGHLLAAGGAVEPETAEHIITTLLDRWASNADPADPGDPAPTTGPGNVGRCC